MSDVEVAIKIPEEIYNKIKDGTFWLDTGLSLSDAYNFIKNGTLIDKGHGRLIDEKEAVNLIAQGKDGNKAYFGTLHRDWEVIDFLKTVPTVLEADKTEGNKT